MKVKIYPFNEAGRKNIEKIMQDLQMERPETPLLRLVKAFENGCKKVHKMPEYTNAIPEDGTRCIGGVMFDFRPVLKRFVVHDRYSGWYEVYGVNKTDVRNRRYIPSRILEIHEISK